MSKQVRKAADLLPKPLKPAKRLAPVDVVSVIRKSRDSGKGSRKGAAASVGWMNVALSAE